MYTIPQLQGNDYFIVDGNLTISSALTKKHFIEIFHFNGLKTNFSRLNYKSSVCCLMFLIYATTRKCSMAYYGPSFYYIEVT